jgi:hypothetical protein
VDLRFSLDIKSHCHAFHSGIAELQPAHFLANEQEESWLVDIIMRFLCLRFKENVSPSIIVSQDIGAIVLRKNTEIWQMPLVMYDQMKVGDCANSLIKSTEKLSSTHSSVKCEIKEHTVPSYGSQMTRRNLDLARGLRANSATSVSRLRVQSPFLCAHWHTKQDMLEKAFKLLYDEDKSSLFCTGVD